jgi:hypothetical protein
MWVVSMLVVAMVSHLLFSQEAGCQTAEDIISRSQEARGGLAALEQRQSVKMSAEVDMVQQGFGYSMTLYRKRPNFYRSVIQVGDTLVVRTTDGRSAWWVNPFMGVDEPEPLPPAEAASFIRSADMDTSLQGLLAEGSEAIFLDRVQENGRSYFRVRITHPGGAGAVNYYDSETYLVRKVVRTAQTETGTQETVILLSEYRPVDGIVYSFRSERQVDGETVVVTTWTAFEHDVPMDDSMFRMGEQSRGR